MNSEKIHVTMTKKGQLVVPKFLRQRLRLEPGDMFIVVDHTEGVLFQKAVLRQTRQSSKNTKSRSRR